MDIAVLGELNLEMEEGDILYPLVCEGVANPPPMISWLLDGREVVQGPELVLSEPLTRYVTPVNSIKFYGLKLLKAHLVTYTLSTVAFARCYYLLLIEKRRIFSFEPMPRAKPKAFYFTV